MDLRDTVYKAMTVQEEWNEARPSMTFSEEELAVLSEASEIPAVREVLESGKFDRHVLRGYLVENTMTPAGVCFRIAEKVCRFIEEGRLSANVFKSKTPLVEAINEGMSDSTAGSHAGMEDHGMYGIGDGTDKKAPKAATEDGASQKKPTHGDKSEVAKKGYKDEKAHHKESTDYEDDDMSEEYEDDHELDGEEMDEALDSLMNEWVAEDMNSTVDDKFGGMKKGPHGGGSLDEMGDYGDDELDESDPYKSSVSILRKKRDAAAKSGNKRQLAKLDKALKLMGEEYDDDMEEDATDGEIEDPHRSKVLSGDYKPSKGRMSEDHKKLPNETDHAKNQPDYDHVEKEGGKGGELDKGPAAVEAYEDHDDDEEMYESTLIRDARAYIQKAGIREGTEAFDRALRRYISSVAPGCPQGSRLDEEARTRRGKLLREMVEKYGKEKTERWLQDPEKVAKLNSLAASSR